jgi:hypothetical protein
MLMVANWTFLTSHARALLCIAHDPGVRQRDIAARQAWASPSAPPTPSSPTRPRPGYEVRQKHGRRNRYQIHAHLPLPEPTRHERTAGEVLAVLARAGAGPS